MSTNALPTHLVGFVHALRDHGVPIGPGETVDAGRVLGALDLSDRSIVREGLACALIRRPSHRPSFDRLFDLWFPSAQGVAEAAQPTPDAEPFQVPRTADGEVDIEQLQAMVAEGLLDDQQQSQMAALLVDELGRYQSRNGPSFSNYQTQKTLKIDELMAKVVAGLTTSSADADVLDRRVAETTAARRVAGLQREIEAEVQRRAVEKLGRERVQTYAVPKQLEDISFLSANAVELAALRRTVKLLARRLASRIANRRRKFRRGEIDLRKTLRASMSTGGVPVKLVQRKPRITRPELVVLCDISGSVAGFSQFTMLLVHALRENFSKLRIFAFIDSTDEVTQYFSSNAQLTEVLPQIIAESKVIQSTSNSDYGRAFATFVERYPDAVSSRTSLLVLGDGRTNYRNPQVNVVADLVRTARHAHWLNPESETYWASGDSAANQYRDIIDMRECRSARQLTALIDDIIPVH